MGRVLIFAKTPYERTPYDQWLKGTGVEPVILVPRQFADGYAHLDDVHAFDDWDTSQLVDKAALRLARERGVDAVFARAEADIVRAAQLRELLGLPGQHTASAAAFRNKVTMKDHLLGGPVELPRYRVLGSAYTAVEFIAEHGYPVVVKPVSESGSLGAAVLRDEADLDRYLRDPWRGTAEIETYVDGQMYHVDGLVAGGEVVFANPSRYLHDCLAFRSDDWLASVPVAVADPVHARLVAATGQVLDALPTPAQTAFHAEFWITPDDRLVFCEIASRTGGAMVAPAIRYSFGIELDKHWLYAECGVPLPAWRAPYRPGGWLVIPPSSGLLAHLPAGDEPGCVRDTQFSGAPGQTFHGGVKSGLFLAGYVVAGESEEVVAANIEEVAAWYSERVRWLPNP